MMSDWHADEALLARYAADELDDARAYSVEAHLMACPTCRNVLAPMADTSRIDAMWAEVADRVDAPSVGVVERGLLRLGVKGYAARLLAATPSLRLSWLAAEALVLGFAVLAANSASGRPEADAVTLIFLMTAAFLPVVGIAVAFGPGVDPVYEIGVSAPMRSYRLLLLRATAVLATSLCFTFVASLALPRLDWTAAAWLLPSLGLSLGTMALATYVRPLHAAIAVGFAWILITVAAAFAPSDPLAVFRVGGQVASLLIVTVSTWVLAHRRGTFEEEIFV